MYRCLDCNNVFEEPGTYREAVGEFHGAPAYQTFEMCPHCKSDFIEEFDEEDEDEEE